MGTLVIDNNINFYFLKDTCCMQQSFLSSNPLPQSPHVRPRLLLSITASSDSSTDNALFFPSTINVGSAKNAKL